MQATQTRVKKEDVYFNFMLNLLVGADLEAVDRYLFENMDAVTEVKNNLLEKIGYKPQPIYRGVILQEIATELAPHPNMKCLSFSEDLLIAKMFADPAHPMALNFWGFEKNYGYIIERTPSPDEILFHYKFLTLFPDYNNYLIACGVDGSTMPLQKEVTILQPQHGLTLKLNNR